MYKRLALIVIMLALAACGGNGHEDLSAFVQNAYKNRKPHVEQMPEVKVTEKFAYKDSGLADPFSIANLNAGIPKVAERESDTGPRPDRTRPKDPLEQYSLESLAMVGTLQRKSTIYGIVKVTTGDGDIYRVKVGDHMGRHYGRITKITNDQISLIELVKSALGGWVEKKAALQLKE